MKRRYQYVKSGFKSLKELRRIFNLTLPPEFDEVLGMDGGSVEELYLQFCAGDEKASKVLKLYGRADIETTRHCMISGGRISCRRFEFEGARR